jgi:hypothetical protein
MRRSRNPLKFAILFISRSGSTNLIEALDSHTQIKAQGEFMAGKDKQRRLPATRRFLLRPRRKQIKAVGFKTKLKDVPDLQEFAELLLAAGASIILLRRRNVIKQTVSRINSFRLFNATKEWNLYGDEDRLPPLTIAPAHFDETLKLVEKETRELEEYVESLSLPTLRLFYEELLVTHQATLERICTFLGVHFEAVQGRTVKYTSDDLRQAVSNFEELRSHYSGTPYEQMFDEVLLTQIGSQPQPSGDS